MPLVTQRPTLQVARSQKNIWTGPECYDLPISLSFDTFSQGNVQLHRGLLLLVVNDPSTAEEGIWGMKENFLR